MQEDNIYRRQTVPQSIPPQQQDEADKEKSEVLTQLTQIKASVDNLKKWADFYESTHSISDADRKDPAVFMHVFDGNAKAAAILRLEAQRLEDLVTEHAS